MECQKKKKDGRAREATCKGEKKEGQWLLHWFGWEKKITAKTMKQQLPWVLNYFTKATASEDANDG